MERRGSLLKLLPLAFVCAFLFSSMALAQSGGHGDTLPTGTPEWAPEVTLPDDSLIIWCVADSICYDITVWDPDASDSITMTLLSGPIDFEPMTFGREFTYTACFLPEVSGEYEFVWQFVDRQQHVVIDTVIYTIEAGVIPVLEDQQFFTELCDLREDRVLSLEFTGTGDDLLFELIFGPGSIDPATGVITYQPDTSGTFVFEVGLTSDCGGDTATITDELVLNLPPHCIGFDSVIYLCDIEEICFDVFAFDPEGDPIEISLLEGLGTFTQTSDTSGISCFTPADLDSARYIFIYRSADSCILQSGEALSEPYCCLDTVKIDVVITRPGELTCPADTTIELCAPPLELPVEICLPGFASTWETTTVNFGTFYEDELCFMADTLGVYAISFVGSDTCGHIDTCTTLVTVKGNNEPYVTMADDYAVELCVPETICFEATADDLDFDIASVSVNYGDFNQSAGLVCFDADSSGVYEIIMTATDECGLTAADTTVVTVDLNTPPTVDLGDDRQFTLCSPEEICIDAVITGDRINFYSTSGGGYYNEQTGQVCFTPTESGQYEIFLQVEDACDNVVADTILVDVSLASVPTIAGLADSTVYLCYPTEICVDVTVDDADGDIADISVNRGTYQDGKICFVPYSMGTVELILTVTDECGNMAVDTGYIEVLTDQIIELVCPNDTTVFLCEPDTLCFPVGGIPDGAEVTVDGLATYWDAETESICFYSDCCLENELTISVTTACGTYSCSFNVSVQTNSRPLVLLPTDTTVFLCEAGTVCLPIGITDVDGNIDLVKVTGAEYDAYENTICFDAEVEGSYPITVTVTDSCGAVATDEIDVMVDFNEAPLFSGPFETTNVTVCVDQAEPVRVVVPIEISDPDGNLDPSLPVEAVFEISEPGLYCQTLVATDECGLADTLEVCVQADPIYPPVIACPEPIEHVQCGVGEFCIDIPISGDFEDVSVSFGEWIDGRWCVNVDRGINTELTVIATGPCGADTCTVPVYLWPVNSPSLTCPSDLDTLLCGPDTLMFELALLSGSGPNESITVNPPAWVEVDGRTATVYVPFEQPGRETITVTHSSDPCEPFICSFDVTATLNTAPTLSAVDKTFELCALTDLCLPFQYADTDGDLVEIGTSVGSITFGEGTGEVCFTPPDFGEYSIDLTISDPCGSAQTITVVATVAEVDEIAIDCPTFVTPPTFCDAGPHCLELPIVGMPDSVVTSFGSWSDDQFCFDFTEMSTGYLAVTVIAYAKCNVDTCTFEIGYLTPVEVSCIVPDSTFLVCTETETPLHMPVKITGDEYTVRVEPDIYSFSDGFVNMTLTQAGVYPVTVIASNACSTDSCEFVVTVDLNTKPVVTFGDDYTLSQCEFEEICVPYTLDDLEGDVVTLSSSDGVIVNGTVCFTPDAYGTFELILTATDDCGAVGEDTFHITIEPGQFLSMTCPPEVTPVNINIPDSVRVPVGIAPLDGVDITVFPSGYYDIVSGEAVVYIESEGLHEFTITAAAQCNTDSCRFFIEVGEYIPPYVECIGTVDTLLCLSRPRTLCLPVSVFGTNVQVEVSDGATFTGDAVCIDIDAEGEYVVDIMAYTDRDTVSCQSVLTVTGGNPPLLEMPVSLDYSLCQPGDICFDVVLEDAEFDITNINLSYGSYDINTGQICFAADTAGTYGIEMSVADSCGNLASGMTTVMVDFNQEPYVELSGDQTIFGCTFAEICVDVIITDDTPVTVATNIGTYNESTGQICFMPDQSGSYELVVEVTDPCGAKASDTLMIEVSANEPPVMAALRDTTVYICYPTPICIDVDVQDPDGNITSVTSSRGTFENGQVCFVPYSQGEFEIIVTAIDECGATVEDTAVVTIQTDQGIELVCPEDTTIFLCEPDTLCFPIGGIPEGAEVTVDGLATYWNAQTQSVCFYSDCCLENEVTVYVSTECGTYSCSFNVSVQTNSRPLVLMPQDSTVLQCELGPICLPVGITDIDGNIESIQVTGAEYDAYTNTVCFNPNDPGDYLVTVTATDTCGLVGTDEMLVSVVINEGPIVSYTPIDTVYKQCAPEEVCVPITVSDINDNIADITVTGGHYDADLGVICILPTGLGEFCAQVVVTDECGLTAGQEVCITVGAGDYVEIACNEFPNPGPDLCEAGTVCYDLSITGDNFTVSTDYGSWADNQLCFMADTTGTYVVTVITEAQCVVDTCVVTVPITVLEPLSVTCPESDSIFTCEAVTASYEFSYTPATAQVEVSAPAYLENGRILVPIEQAGTQTFTVTASNHCGTVECSFDVKAVFNTAPTVSLGDDLSFTECDLHEICIPVNWIDPDNNGREWQAEISTEVPGFTATDTEICFTPPEFGQYYIVYSAMDDCGAQDVDTVLVTYLEGKQASIQCPDGTQYASICGADTVCFVAPIVDAETITILPNGFYTPGTGEVCIYVDEGGTHEVTIIAEAQCGSDTCKFNLEVDMGEVPVVECPGQIDTLLCLVEPDTLRIPITATGTGLQVNVNPTGYFSAGVVNLPIEQAGEYNFEIIAFGSCGADTCEIVVNVTADQAPVLTLPETLTFERCPDDVDPICIDGIFATDVESQVTIRQVCGPGMFSGPRPDSGAVCFVPSAFGEIELCFEADDGCHVVSGSMIVNIRTRDDCDVCVRLAIDGGEATPVGLRKRVDINIETNDAIGGFDLLLGFDASALTFFYASTEGGPAETWEYFTWNLDNNGCGNACPSGLVRFVGIADRNNGAAHPPDSAYSPQGSLFFIEFQVANDQNLGDVFVPISFVWYDCADNAVSDTTGTALFVDSRIFNPEGVLLWDEYDELGFPESARQDGLGAPDSCITIGEKTQAIRCIEFINGGIKIIDPEEIDDRGDVNLNNLAYEIADAVVFTNYFIRGLSAFSINVAGQVAATDCNADGLTLTVADLTLLIRVVVGDASPMPKVTPHVMKAPVYSSRNDGYLTIGTETSHGIGAAYFVYEMEPGMVIGEPRALGAASEFNIVYGIYDNRLHVLMYDIGRARVEAGLNDIIEVPVYGDGELTMVHADLADYYSRPYTASIGNILPQEYQLMQNYPNPFNPATTITFALPAASGWSLKIYNITGAMVWEQNGHSDGGLVDVVWDGRDSGGNPVASGVYLYRLDANTFSNTRKMILLK